MKHDLNWHESWLATEGPTTWKESLILVCKGYAMGIADLIPGVSGGTIAFITGIYQQLLNALSSFDTRATKFLLKLQFKNFLACVHLRFLLTLFLGIFLALLSISRVVHYCLVQYPEQTWSFFFGVILASVPFLMQRIGKISIQNAASFIAGLAFAYWLTGIIPRQTPETYWFIFLCGTIAICAMILPGISGSFLLLILGKYELIIGAIKNPFVLENLMIVMIFATGALIGLLSFSRLVKLALNSFEALSLAFLTGAVVGALRKVWPWKEVVESKWIRGKEYVLQDQNIFPDVNLSLLISLGVMISGAVIVILLERTGQKEDRTRQGSNLKPSEPQSDALSN